MEQERKLSQRELEQLELQGERTQNAVDAVDEQWPEICAAAAVVKDCHVALVKQHVPESVAYSLVPSVVQVLLAGRK